MKFPPQIQAAIALAGLAMVVPASAADLKVPPERLANYWLLTTKSLDADIPNSGRGLDQPGCAAVSYTVGADGVPRDLVVRKVVPATSDFGPVALSVIHQFNYTAGTQNPSQQPVHTYYIVPFNLPADAGARERITQACALKTY